MSHHGPQYQDGGTHGLHQLVGRGEFLDGSGVHFHVHAVVDHHVDAHAAQQLDQGGDILQVRQITHGDRLVGQQGGGQDRQGRVLGAGNTDFAVKAPATGDDQFIHELSLDLSEGQAQCLSRYPSSGLFPTRPGYR